MGLHAAVDFVAALLGSRHCTANLVPACLWSEQLPLMLLVQSRHRILLDLAIFVSNEGLSARVNLRLAVGEGFPSRRFLTTDEHLEIVRVGAVYALMSGL